MVAVASVINKVISNYVIQTESPTEWALVFEICCVVALAPVIFFSIWGSADPQPWASRRRRGISVIVAATHASRKVPPEDS